jgi:hypothetical protein
MSLVVFQLCDRFQKLQSMSVVWKDTLTFHQNPEIINQALWLSHSILFYELHSV